MADREKVIKETKDGIAFAESRGFGGLANTMRDALAMLKEQQPKEPIYSPQFKHYVCPSCSLVLDEARDDYCPCCGTKIAWDENRYDRV